MIKKYVTIAALALPLGACISIGGAGEAPSQLLTMTSVSQSETGTVFKNDNGQSLVIMTPRTNRVTDNVRVPVYMGDSAIAYVKEAVWVEKPASLLQTMFSDTMSARNILVLNPVQAAGGENVTYLTGDLSMFGYDEYANNVVVRYDAVLKSKDGTVVKKRFKSRESVSVVEARPVAAALNDASNNLSKDLADWVVSELSEK